MLVGFLGEMEEEFQQFCDFVCEMCFDCLGVFQYSYEEDICVYEFFDDVFVEVKVECVN